MYWIVGLVWLVCVSPIPAALIWKKDILVGTNILPDTQGDPPQAKLNVVAPGQVDIEQEVLAERLAGGKLVAPDDVAQRRQVGRARVFRAHRGRDMRSAIAIAAIRLDGDALPDPASVRAVPWSGDVRTNGRPRVTLTAESNAMVLIGISAWS